MSANNRIGGLDLPPPMVDQSTPPSAGGQQRRGLALPSQPAGPLHNSVSDWNVTGPEQGTHSTQMMVQQQPPTLQQDLSTQLVHGAHPIQMQMSQQPQQHPSASCGYVSKIQGVAQTQQQSNTNRVTQASYTNDVDFAMADEWGNQYGVWNYRAEPQQEQQESQGAHRDPLQHKLPQPVQGYEHMIRKCRLEYDNQLVKQMRIGIPQHSQMEGGLYGSEGGKGYYQYEQEYREHGLTEQQVSMAQASQLGLQGHSGHQTQFEQQYKPGQHGQPGHQRQLGKQIQLELQDQLGKENQFDRHNQVGQGNYSQQTLTPGQQSSIGLGQQPLFGNYQMTQRQFYLQHSTSAVHPMQDKPNYPFSTGFQILSPKEEVVARNMFRNRPLKANEIDIANQENIAPANLPTSITSSPLQGVKLNTAMQQGTALVNNPATQGGDYDLTPIPNAKLEIALIPSDHDKRMNPLLEQVFYHSPNPLTNCFRETITLKVGTACPVEFNLPAKFLEALIASHNATHGASSESTASATIHLPCADPTEVLAYLHWTRSGSIITGSSGEASTLISIFGCSLDLMSPQYEIAAVLPFFMLGQEREYPEDLIDEVFSRTNGENVNAGVVPHIARRILVAMIAARIVGPGKRRESIRTAVDERWKGECRGMLRTYVRNRGPVCEYPQDVMDLYGLAGRGDPFMDSVTG
ncbi:hypothetical protein K470DRAFT_291329 [Piedraia hortae CBS 480.64]|uniref:Uncharacterized protein n=1 Tax=Piedraia hortae CBS 480.64 TaxID=1314780 RepID=A0A6A7BQ35_9PEZI|nr:hypothetical protein K470DRAFT_291329 [Piedraia hortae CBS 480.64]